MKKIFILLLILCANKPLFSQSIDTAFTKRISAFTCMPDGHSLLLNIVKEDKVRKLKPTFKKFIFDIETKKMTPFALNESAMAINPDGKTIAYTRSEKNRFNILYLYDLSKQEEKLLIADTLTKLSLNWSADGEKIAFTAEFNIDNRRAMEICILDLSSNKISQITHNFPFFSLSPAFNPVNNQIVYFIEKGDGHDQIYLTDTPGSFNKNLSNDTTSHNYSPQWVDDSTILYIKSPASLMIMNTNSRQVRKIPDVNSTIAKCHPGTGCIIYMGEDDGNLYEYNIKNNNSYRLIDRRQIQNMISF